MMMKTIDERSILETTSSLRIIECSNSSLSSSTTSSSIGNNSDTNDQDQNDDYDDIQSPYNYNNNNGSGSSSSSSSSFDDAIQALEQALPIRRGISTFYNGKSKSFTNLNSEWPTTPISIQDIAKPETPFTRKRRNLSNFKLPNMNTGRICKKSKATTLHFSATLEREKDNLHNFPDHGALSQVKRPLPSRSFSMVNLLR
uniref:putative vacuolar protein sorting-associated protein 13D n=1 Tax=Erigeron canadensis TaxID=72917 RepID=UPI001CB89AC8|nr:putative vacuolar protein sorting-associated protein 13D [Erigeron canadensis]